MPSQSTLSKPSDDCFRQMMRRWPRRVIRLAVKLVMLPPVNRQGVKQPERIWAFLYALDHLSHNPSAIQALANVYDQIEHRPTYDETLVFAMAALEARKALHKVMQDRERHRPAKTPKYGFRRGV